MIDNLAVLLANGKYAQYLHTNLCEGTTQKAFMVSLLPAHESVFTEDQIEFVCELNKIGKFLDKLKEKGITRLVFGGDYRLPKSLLKFRSLADSDRLSKSYIMPLMFGGFPAALNKLSEDLNRFDVQPVCASEIIPELKLQEDIYPANDFAWSIKEQNEIICLIARAKLELNNQPHRSVRQVIAFDGENLVAVETDGTDSMLKSLAEKRKTEEKRIVLKLCPSLYDFRFDPPVIAEKTIEGAIKAKVDVFVFDDISGIVFEQKKVKKLCLESGLKLVRLSSFGPDIGSQQVSSLGPL